MNNEAPQRTALDRQAALEELERFKQDIERYRAQRQAVGERFETFIRSFETPAAPPAIDLIAAPAPSAAASEPALPDARGEVGEIAASAPSVDEPVAIDTLDPYPSSLASAGSAVSPASPPPPDRPFAPVISSDAPEPREGVVTARSSPPQPSRVPRARSTISTPVLIGGVLIVVLAGGMLARTLWTRAPEATPPASTTPAAPVAAPEPTPAAAPAPAVATVSPTSQSELTTIRRVWMRVTVDGERVLEREVPADSKVPLNAEKTIVIRTGDAGAVKLSIRGGAPAALGAEGEVVTRSFTVPPRAPAGR